MKLLKRFKKYWSLDILMKELLHTKTITSRDEDFRKKILHFPIANEILHSLIGQNGSELRTKSKEQKAMKRIDGRLIDIIQSW